jgi:arylsulfatase A-like enzyme
MCVASNAAYDEADPQRVAALPEILSDAGYETIMSGMKFFLFLERCC